MSPLTTLIVDDELDSRESLQTFLERYCPEVRVVGQCSNIDEAEQAIATHNPQLLLLDIEMPFGNAFDLLERLPDLRCEIIFITAFSQYALRAFNLSAAHYLLKPIDIDELVEAVAKARDRLSDRSQLTHARVILDNLRQTPNQQQKLALPLLNGLEFVRMDTVVYCEAEDNFTRFYLSDQRELLICRKLRFYEDLLGEFGFCRIHRSYLVNLAYAKRYLRGKGGSLLLENGKTLTVSNGRKAAFLAQLQGRG